MHSAELDELLAGIANDGDQVHGDGTAELVGPVGKEGLQVLERDEGIVGIADGGVPVRNDETAERLVGREGVRVGDDGISELVEGGPAPTTAVATSASFKCSDLVEVARLRSSLNCR